MVRPVTLTVVAGAAPVVVVPPGEAVTVYGLIGEPPTSDGAVHDTCAEAFPGWAVTAVGGSGSAAPHLIATVLAEYTGDQLSPDCRGATTDANVPITVPPLTIVSAAPLAGE